MRTQHLVASMLLGFVRGFVIQRPVRNIDDTQLSGIFDSFFLRKREGDFVKLEDTASNFGPGPLIVLYNVPNGILDEEIIDMVDDADHAVAKNLKLHRVNDQSDVLELTLLEALSKLVDTDASQRTQAVEPTDDAMVILFSGISNAAMMSIYEIVGQEIYLETNRSPACAKAVPKAMEKPLRQVLTEIAGDHAEATTPPKGDE